MKSFLVFCILLISLQKIHAGAIEKDVTKPHACNHIMEGSSCDNENCQPCGYCWKLHSFYFRCNRTQPSDPKLPVTGQWVHESCDPAQWWNPALKPEGVHIEEGFGGSCDNWGNLSEDVKAFYRQDANCVKPVSVCEWGQDEPCSRYFWYFDPSTMSDRYEMDCGEGVMWDPSTETCRKCVQNCDC